MYNQPGRRRGISFADSHDRQPSASHHSGSREDFLRRHEDEANTASREGGEKLSQFRQSLLTRAGDFRNVVLAIEHCASRGQAAGPNGLKPSQLDRHAKFDLARVLGELITTGEYCPGRDRTQPIPKGGDRGDRLIKIQDFDNRCVERAILQVIRPLTEAQYLPTNLGFRSPGRSREEAIAFAERMAFDSGRWVWICEDLSNAFEMIPTGRLMQTVRNELRNQQLCDLIERLVSRPSGRGIRQGGPLSPEMLNVYLHPRLDLWWQRRFPETPLLRVADDLLILARTTEEALELYGALDNQCRSIGMPLKGNPFTTIHDLSVGQRASWLGYSLGRQGSGLQVSIANKSWTKLEEHIQLAWETDVPALKALDCIQGWISQQGAAYRDQDVDVVYAGIRRLAFEAGFEEIPTRDEIASLWVTAYRRDWVRTRRETLLRIRRSSGFAGSFADQHCDFDASLRPQGVVCPTVTPPLGPPRRRLFLFTDGSCLKPTRIGAWAYLLVDDEHPDDRVWYADSHPRTTNNRMELTAVLNGLRAVGTEPCELEIISDSQYVVDGLTTNLATWLRHGWRNPNSSCRVSHPLLWKRVVRALQPHSVRCRWVPGHSGHPENEFVDRLARDCAESHQARLQQNRRNEAMT